jgi:hypothetical protein
MYYNSNDNITVSRLPKNLIKTDGSIFINFNLADMDTLSDYGYYTIRNDVAQPKPTSIEDVTQRTVILEKPYADINRVWLNNNIDE